MQRLILGIAGFGAFAGLLAMVALGLAGAPAPFERPALRLSVQFSVTL